MAGHGFEPGATAGLEKGSTVINGTSVQVVSENKIKCSFDLRKAPLGTYDVVVRNPGGKEARLPARFKVSNICGQGGGSSVLLLGIALGMLSLAGLGVVRYRRP